MIKIGIKYICDECGFSKKRKKSYIFICTNKYFSLPLSK